MILTDKRFARLLKAKAYKEKISDVGRGVRSLLGGAKNNSRASAYSALIEERWLTTSGLPFQPSLSPLRHNLQTPPPSSCTPVVPPAPLKGH